MKSQKNLIMGGYIHIKKLPMVYGERLSRGENRLKNESLESQVSSFYAQNGPKWPIFEVFLFPGT